MIMISTSNIEQAKKLIKREKQPIVVLAKDNNFNRKILEYGRFQSLQNPMEINHVMAKIATKNNISISYNLSEIAKLSKEEKARKLEKIIPILKTLRKAKTKLKITNFKDQKDASAFLTTLGASTFQTKEAF